jgi:murein hydrolase activator
VSDRRTLAVALCALLAAAPLAPLHAQQDTSLAASRRRLDQIKAERSRLEQQQLKLQGQVNDAAAEVTNLEAQRDATTRLVNELERQMKGLGSQLDQSAAELALAQDNLAEREAVLRRRLVDIYKRGPLYTFQVLLTAESFGDLLTRYKYLYLTSRQDRALVNQVKDLTATVQQRRNTLLGIRSQLDDRRQEHEQEMQHYSQLVGERQTALHQLQQNAQQTTARISALDRDAAQLNDLIARLARASRPTDANAPGALTTADLGKLDWPVDGTILYQFGAQSLPTGGVIRHNGIAIAAPAGTPVKAVEAGQVALVQRFGTYGLSVFVRHPNGYWSLYMQLQKATVKAGESVTRGEEIGTVGGANSAEKTPHLYFEIRGDNEIALDPLVWLKRRGGQ